MSRWGCFDAGDLFLSGCIIPSKSAGLKACEGAPFTPQEAEGWLVLIPDSYVLHVEVSFSKTQNQEIVPETATLGWVQGLKTVYSHSVWIHKLLQTRLSTGSQQAQLVTEGIVRHLRLLIDLWLELSRVTYGEMDPGCPLWFQFFGSLRSSRPSLSVCFLFPCF